MITASGKTATLVTSSGVDNTAFTAEYELKVNLDGLRTLAYRANWELLGNGRYELSIETSNPPFGYDIRVDGELVVRKGPQ